MAYERIEVIDHTSNGEGRVFVKHLDNMHVELSKQDDGKTLKIFISHKEAEDGQ